MSHLLLEGLSKSYGKAPAVSDVSLSIEQGECLALLGPSGCGKTTILRMIAGLEHPDAGRLVLAGRDITKLPPELRRIGLVFQNYALFPHLSVAENVAFGLAARRKDAGFIKEKVEASLGLVQLAGFGARRIHELSGGEQQRVAIARSLAIEPEVLLLDEPLSNLDVALREQTGRQLRALIERLRITTIFVTHDQAEAFALADRIALLNKGRQQQTGEAAELYFKPNNLFVAQFIGRGNFLRAMPRGAADGFMEYEVEGRFRLLGPAPSDGSENEATLRIRPEAIRIAADQSDEREGLKARIESIRFAGAIIHYGLDVSGISIEATALTEPFQKMPEQGQECRIHIPPEAVMVFPIK